MNTKEGSFSRQDSIIHPVSDNARAPQQRDPDVSSLETALHSVSENRVDWHLGPGVIFDLGPTRQTHIELYPHVVRVTVPTGQLAIPRRDADVVPDGVVFQDPEQFSLSVGSTGNVLFHYFPTPADAVPELRDRPEARHHDPVPAEPLPAPLPPAPKEHKAKSERYVGRLGEVRTHRTKHGKVVAEVELTVPDPERPGASRLIKCAAFGEKAEALQQNYQPGQEVTAVGIPHELRRRGKDGQEWTERQLYLVQLPKPR